MPRQATVLIPTHDHGPLLLHSARSALAQTVEDIEVFVVGDGVPHVTREIVAELARDERVRFFDYPKGPRNGEAYRHEVLQEAEGEIVCYLSDDDLWLPGHVEYMRDLLKDADFAHALPLNVSPSGGFGVYAVDLTLDIYRELLSSGINRVPLSCGAHTMKAYRRLPHGWRTTPTGTPTDLYMWQQILDDPNNRAASGAIPTILNFPSPQRRDQTPEDRLAELEAWSGKVRDPEWLDLFAAEVLDAVIRIRAGELARLESELRGCVRRTEDLEAAHQQQSETAENLGRELTLVRREARSLEDRLQAIRGSRTWKMLNRLNRFKARLLGKTEGG